MSEGAGVNPNWDIVPNFLIFFSGASPFSFQKRCQFYFSTSDRRQCYQKVRKVDIRYAMRTFLILQYTFGTHLSLKVHIFSTTDNYHRYKHEIRFDCRLLATRHIQLGETSALITDLNATWQLDKLMNKINWIPQFYYFCSLHWYESPHLV